MSLSKRAQELMGETSAIVEASRLCAADPFDPVKNKNGYLNFSIAENHLIEDLILDKINSPLPMNSTHSRYNTLFGREDVRDVSCLFLEKYLNITHLSGKNISIQAGVSAICECLSFSLFDEDDYLMLAAPFYSGFDYDFRKRFGVNFLEVNLDQKKNFIHEVSSYKKAYDSFQFPEKIKAILVTHPHNPSGEVLSKEFIQEITHFAKQKDLVIISDEIYALSTHTNQAHFSLFEYAKENGVKSHLLYGMAKDFALAGIKVGFHYTNDTEMRDAMQALSYFHPVSSHTQELTKFILSDHSFINSLIFENQKRLSEMKNYMEESLGHLKFLPSQAGLFCLLDLSKMCKTFEEEKNLQLRLFNEFKIKLLPGQDLGLSVPGFFRICFSRKKEELTELIKRLKDFS